VQVEGVDISKVNVDYANARAKILNLSGRAQFSCKDLRSFRPEKRYDVVSSLGIESDLYGGRASAFRFFKDILKEGGIVIFSEPVWKKKPVEPRILKRLRCSNDSFLTMKEMDELIKDSGLEQLGCFVASKTDWELYVQSPILGLKEIIRARKEQAPEAKVMLEGFKTENTAAGEHWDIALWVLKPFN
jgi:SAM-dependent methyltransferase